MTLTAYAKSIDMHYEGLWSEPIESFRLEKGKILDLPDDFCVHLFKRTDSTVAFATRCMSQSFDDERIELYSVCSPSTLPICNFVEILTAVAHFHRTGKLLSMGDSVNFGEPWAQGSDCTYGLISLPYLDGPSLEWMSGSHVRFLWVIPITKEEVEFKKIYGLDALEERFELSQLNYLDPYRVSVVK